MLYYYTHALNGSAHNQGSTMTTTKEIKLSTARTVYTIHAGDNSTDLGQVGSAKTIRGAKRVGRAAVRASLPRGQGTYRVRDARGAEILVGERSIRTDYEWIERQ